MTRMTLMLLLMVMTLACVTLQTSAVTSREKRSDDVSTIEVQVQQLTQTVSDLIARMTAVESKQETTDRRVAFQARMSRDPFDVTVGGDIAYDYVITNVGNAYDPQSGIFTAPVAGIYAFHITCVDRHDINHAFYLDLVVKGTKTAECVSESPPGDSEMASAHAAVHLQAGDRVWTQSEHTESARGSFLTTFGGYLVNADVY